jgi:hypothetical protein
MRTLLSLILLLPLLAIGDDFPRVTLSGRVNWTAPATTYIINEDCEGANAPSGWFDNMTPDWDNTDATVLAGSQQWYKSTGSDARSYFEFSDGDSFTAVLMFKIADATPANVRSLCGWRDSTGATLAVARLNTTGTLAIYTDGSNSTATTDALSDNTAYYIKMRWTEAGTASIEFATSFAFTGSGTKYTSKSTSFTTTDCTRFYLGTTTGTTDAWYFDNIQMSASDIPNP